MTDNTNIQEQIIQKKLLFKFEKNLNKFSSEYFKLYTLSFDHPEYAKTVASLNEDIDQLEYQNFKYQTALKSIATDQLNNQHELESTTVQIESTKKQIQQMKATLAQQEQIKQNKQEFNQIAVEIKTYDRQSEMDNQIAEVEQQIKQMDEEYEEELQKINLQEQYLRTLLSSLNCLTTLSGSR